MSQAETRAYAETLQARASALEARLHELAHLLATDRARLADLAAMDHTEARDRAARLQEQIAALETEQQETARLAARLRQDAAELLAALVA